MLTLQFKFKAMACSATSHLRLSLRVAIREGSLLKSKLHAMQRPLLPPPSRSVCCTTVGDHDGGLASFPRKPVIGDQVP